MLGTAGAFARRRHLPNTGVSSLTRRRHLPNTTSTSVHFVDTFFFFFPHLVAASCTYAAAPSSRSNSAAYRPSGIVLPQPRRIRIERVRVSRKFEEALVRGFTHGEILLTPFQRRSPSSAAVPRWQPPARAPAAPASPCCSRCSYCSTRRAGLPVGTSGLCS